MKKIFSLFLLLVIFSCKSVVQEPAKIVNPAVSSQYQTHDQFESRNLNMANENRKKIQVALFLPFSGKYQELGWHLFNAASLAMFENDLNHNIELILVDSKDTAADAKKAFKTIIDRDIKIVIGPVFSSLVEAIERPAKHNAITAISLSNNQELVNKIDEDGGVFLAGMMPESEIDKIVTYAMEEGKTSFAVIAPSSQYGTIITNLVKKFVKDRDGNFIISEFYQPNSKSLDKVVERAINAFILPPRLTSKKYGKLSKEDAISESDRIYPQVIMIPESGKNLSKIANLINQLNREEREIQLVGTSQWDDISTLNEPNLVGAWFVAPGNEKFRSFEKTYYQSYNQFPPRISSIVYDSVSAISILIDRNQGRVPTVTDFTSYFNPPKNGFEGVDGLFRFLPNGLVQRNLAVLEVEKGRFEVLEKPVEKFLRY